MTTKLVEPVKTTYRRDEFFLKWMISLALEDGDPVRLLYLQRARLYKELHKLNQEKMKANPGTELAHVLLLDQAIMHTEADLRWLDMMEARLDEIKRTGVWLGYLFVAATNGMGFKVDYSFPVLGILVGIAAGLLFGLIGAIIPARHAARVTLLDALQYE